MILLLTSCSTESLSKDGYYGPELSGGLAGGTTEGGYASEDSSLESPGEYEPTSPDYEDSSNDSSSMDDDDDDENDDEDDISKEFSDDDEDEFDRVFDSDEDDLGEE